MIPATPFVAPGLAHEVRVGARAVSHACQIAEAMRRDGNIGQVRKPDGSSVTLIDYTLQPLIIRWLLDRFPQDKIVAEEQALSLYDLYPHHEGLRRITREISQKGKVRMGNPLFWMDCQTDQLGPRTWVIDPVDATDSLPSGNYAVNLALIHEGIVVLGIMGIPHLRLPQLPNKEGLLLLAVKGHGSWVAPLDGSAPFERLHVSSRGPEQAVLLRSLANLKQINPEDGAFLRTLYSGFMSGLNQASLDQAASSPIRYALLAAGVGDVTIRVPLTPPWTRELRAWDHAPGVLLVEEAGGQVTDLKGQPLNFGTGPVLTDNVGLLASNGLSHDLGLTAYQAALDTFPTYPPRPISDGMSVVKQGLTSVSGRMPRFRPPFLVIVDVHGTILEPNWKAGFENVYRVLRPHEGYGKAANWVAENTYGIPDAEVFERLAALRRGLTPETVTNIFSDIMTLSAETEYPNPMAGIEDFFQWLRRKKITIVALTYAKVGRENVLRQLDSSGLLSLIEGKNVVTRENIPGSAGKDDFRDKAIQQLAHDFRTGTMVFCNDTPDGMEAVSKLEGVNIGVPQGEGLDWELRSRMLITGGAHFLIRNWQSAIPDLQRLLSV